MLGEVITFIDGDVDTKKELAIEWGEKIEDVAEGIWDIAGETLEIWGDKIEACVESAWGDVYSTFDDEFIQG